MKEAVQSLEQALQYRKSVILCRSDAISWNDSTVASVTDALFAQEIVNGPDLTVKLRGIPKAFMILLVDPRIGKEETAECHTLRWRSLKDKRVSRATFTGEAH